MNLIRLVNGVQKYKVKHVFLFSLYAASLFICFLHMIYFQNPNSFSTLYFVFNVYLWGVLMLVKAILWIVKNWNKNI